MGGLLQLVQLRGDWAGPQRTKPLLTVPNVTAHPSTNSVPITVLLYNGPLPCGFNVPIKGLKNDQAISVYYISAQRLLAASVLQVYFVTQQQMI